MVGLRVLVVEDTHLIATELRKMLEDLKCPVIDVAAQLDKATALAESAAIDGVLLDLNLAGRQSYPVAEILRERGIPFIIMSGYDASYLREDYANAAYLQKPFDCDELTTMMLRTFCPAAGEHD
ncbi:MAG: response regulator [Phycisphaerales bacterium]|nr:MAG: response regulator [Phycisphaerales bacterium]